MKRILSMALIFMMSLSLVGCSSDDESSSKPKEKKEYAVGETASIDDVNYTVTAVNTSQGGEFNKPEEGKEYVVVSVKIENKSEDKIDYNCLYFKMVNSSGQEDTIDIAALPDQSLDSGDLIAGGVKEGNIAFSEPVGDSCQLKVYKDILYEDALCTFKIR